MLSLILVACLWVWVVCVPDVFLAGCVRFTPLQKERERGAVVLCVFSVSERASVKVGKRLHTSQVQRLKESERERDWKKVWATKADCVGKKHDKGRKRAENRSGSWGDTEIMIRRFRRKTPVSDTDRLMNRGLVNVSESERSLLNSPLTQSDGLILYVCVCLVYLGSLVSRHESDLTQPPSGTPSSVFSWKHESYSAFLTFPP